MSTTTRRAALAALLTAAVIGGAACGSEADSNPLADTETTTTEAPAPTTTERPTTTSTTEAPPTTTTTEAPAPTCAELEEAWWNTDAGSDAEWAAEGALEISGCAVPTIPAPAPSDAVVQDAFDIVWAALSDYERGVMCTGLYLDPVGTGTDVSIGSEGLVTPAEAVDLLMGVC